MAPKKIAFPGEVYAIPLFVSDIDNLTRFKKKDIFINDNDFAFTRIIEDTGGSGIIIEVFNYKGKMDSSINEIVSKNRLFPPVVISGLAMTKKRWVKIGFCDNYDKEIDSHYSEIGLIMRGIDKPILWKNGEETVAKDSDYEKYEKWEIWGADHLEKRIISSLK